MESTLIPLLEEYLRTGRQWVLHRLTDSCPDEWPVERMCLYQFGPVSGKYRERDPETLRVIEKMSRPEAEKSVKREIWLSLQRELHNLEAQPELDFQAEKLQMARKKLHALQTEPIQQWAEVYGCTGLIPVDPKDIPGFLYLDYAYQNYQYHTNSQLNSSIIHWRPVMEEMV